jgi:crotonobetainyl-CoA:carnitine CoA-transferase CaiB-like acyl-CoA transferase
MCWSWYRLDALARLGLGAEVRRQARPGLIDVSLDAYGWTGPWRGRRGFDSLVQMSAGIADEGMRRFGKDRPTPLPVQALDHATGYLVAAAVVRGLTTRLATGADARRELACPRGGAPFRHPGSRGITSARPEGARGLSGGDRAHVVGSGALR